MSHESIEGKRPQEHGAPDVVRLLEMVLAPVEPPASLADELETRLADVQAAALEALEEFADWEADAMRDPRNWVRPAAAIAVGTAAGAALVLLRMRHVRRQQHAGLRGLAEQSGRDLLGALAATRARIR